MSEFFTPADIGNRALQLCGAPRMDPTLGLAEVSERASSINFCYGKLRRAELERNTWSFATRRQILRAVGPNTMILAPALWSSFATYFVGSIVADSSGNLWQSRIPNNLNNDPASTSAWEPYFGPMSAMLYDSSTSYFSGEIVFTKSGAGTYNVYLSLMNANSLDPSLPNQWSVSTTYNKNNVVQAFAAWSSVTTYAAGQGVLYTDGNVYASLIAGNLNNIPTAAASATKWVLVPVVVLASQNVPSTTTVIPPRSSPVVEWVQLTTYGLGAFVLFNGTLYVSIQTNNTGNFPTAAASTFWAAVTLGTLYMSLIDLNYGNSPATAPALWSSVTTYAATNQVGGSDGVIYQSIAGGNLNHDPTTDAGVHWTNTGVLNPWTTVFTQGGGNQQWSQIGGAAFPFGVGLAELNIVYPIGSGPSTQEATRNVYRLPSGYLKVCNQDPKAGSTSYLGAPSGLAYKDWLFEGDYLVSRDVGPIMFRFVADMTDVTKMKTMFCEGLAARIGKEICQTVTQSNAKLGEIKEAYDKVMGEARTVNAIEVGPEEPPEDDWVQCRL